MNASRKRKNRQKTPVQPTPVARKATKPKAEAVKAKAEAAIGKAETAVETRDNLRSWAQSSVDRAEEAFGRVEDKTLEAMRFVDSASNTFKTAATELQLRAFQIGGENAAAIVEYWRELIGLRNSGEIAEFHHRYFLRQVSAMTDQFLELTGLGFKVAASLPLPLPDLKSSGLSE